MTAVPAVISNGRARSIRSAFSSADSIFGADFFAGILLSDAAAFFGLAVWRFKFE
jgi:hypothetical protein